MATTEAQTEIRGPSVEMFTGVLRAVADVLKKRGEVLFIDRMTQEEMDDFRSILSRIEARAVEHTGGD